MPNLDRFLNAQRKTYDTALQEVRQGKKRSHWMWYIFPQLQGLGHSETAQFYALTNLAAATAYLKHPILGKRLVEISQALLALGQNDAMQIFGSPDHLKLKSSMTLFAAVSNTSGVFEQVLHQYFNGQVDEPTLSLLR